MADLPFLTWLTLGFCLVYIIAVDPNVYPWLALQWARLRLEVQKAWFKIRHYPDSPWVRHAVKRNADRLATEMLKNQNDN